MQASRRVDELEECIHQYLRSNFFPTFERDPFATFLVTSFVRWAAVHVSALLMLLVSGSVKGLKRLL